MPSRRRGHAPRLVLPRDAEDAPPVDVASITVPCQPSEEPCSICLDLEVTVALPCGHAFHQQCLEQWLAVRPSCPNCSCSYGARTGSMPDGEMSWHRSSTTLAGLTCGTIVLHLNFPAGISPAGVHHEGRVQHAYLPDDEQGHQLLAMFALAFRRRLLFALSHSLTTGQHRPTFSVHLKTATCGGPARHGFPDPDYYANALSELRAVGIAPADAPPSSVDLGPRPSPLQAFVSNRGFLSVLSMLQSTCLAYLFIAQQTESGRAVVLPTCGVVMALWRPGQIMTLVAILSVGAMLGTADNETTSSSDNARGCVAWAMTFAAAVYTVVARAASGRRCERPFRQIARRTRKLISKSSVVRNGALFLALLAIEETMRQPIVWVALICTLMGILRDSARFRCKRRRRRGGSTSSGSAGGAVGRRGRSRSSAEPLLGSRQLISTPSVPAAIAAAAASAAAAGGRRVPAAAAAASAAAPPPRAQAASEAAAPAALLEIAAVGQEAAAAASAAEADSAEAGRPLEEEAAQQEEVGGGGAATGLPRRTGPITDEDWAECAECPSLRGRPDAPVLHSRLLGPAGEFVRHRVHSAVREMLRNELEFSEEYSVFYHSYSASCLIYELQTALACRLLGYPQDGPPVMRLNRFHFAGRDRLSTLLEMHAERRSDHHEGFRKIAISTVVSWFASGGYGHHLLMKHFLRGWFGGHDLGDMTLLIEELLRACGITHPASLTALVADILEVGDKWGLEMSRYKDRGRRRSASRPLVPGHILQVFVHNSVVDSVAYGALPLGKLAPHGSPISAWLARQCPLDGQARLLVHPDLFLDPGSGLARVFTHCGSPMYGPAQRLRVLRELDDLLAPHLSSQEACLSALSGLGFSTSPPSSGSPSTLPPSALAVSSGGSSSHSAGSRT